MADLFKANLLRLDMIQVPISLTIFTHNSNASEILPNILIQIAIKYLSKAFAYIQKTMYVYTHTFTVI